MLISLLLATSALAAESTNAVGRPEYSKFKIIPERNIFNPKRYARSSQAPRESRRAARVDSISLVGIMSYEKGPFAFFDGSSSEYRKVLKLGDSIAGYRLTNIAPNAATLATPTNKVELRVGMRLRREDDGQWQVGGGSDELSSSSYPTGSSGKASSTSRSSRSGSATTNAEPSKVGGSESDVTSAEPAPEPAASTAEPAASSESTETDPVLRRLMERRNQELNR